MSANISRPFVSFPAILNAACGTPVYSLWFNNTVLLQKLDILYALSPQHVYLSHFNVRLRNNSAFEDAF